MTTTNTERFPLTLEGTDWSRPEIKRYDPIFVSSVMRIKAELAQFDKARGVTLGKLSADEILTMHPRTP